MRPDRGAWTHHRLGWQAVRCRCWRAGLFHIAEHGPAAIRLDEIDADTMSGQSSLVGSQFLMPGLQLEDMDGTGDMRHARRTWREASADHHREDRARRHGSPGVISLDVLESVAGDAEDDG